MESSCQFHMKLDSRKFHVNNIRLCGIQLQMKLSTTVIKSIEGTSIEKIVLQEKQQFFIGPMILGL